MAAFFKMVGRYTDEGFKHASGDERKKKYWSMAEVARAVEPGSEIVIEEREGSEKSTLGAILMGYRRIETDEDSYRYTHRLMGY